MHAPRWLLAALLLLSAALTGCGRTLPAEEYGQILFEVPEIPGAEEPVAIPELEDVPRPDPSKHPF